MDTLMAEAAAEQALAHENKTPSEPDNFANLQTIYIFPNSSKNNDHSNSETKKKKVFNVFTLGFPALSKILKENLPKVIW